MIYKYFLVEYGTSCNLWATASHSSPSSPSRESLLQVFAKQQPERTHTSSSELRKGTFLKLTKEKHNANTYTDANVFTFCICYFLC